MESNKNTFFNLPDIIGLLLRNILSYFEAIFLRKSLSKNSFIMLEAITYVLREALNWFE